MLPLPNTFPHHRLVVYRFAKSAMKDAFQITKRIPRGNRHIADQLKRSVTSVVANIAEGANRRGDAEIRQRFVQARGEAGEAEAWLEILVDLEICRVEEVSEAAFKLDRVARMLTKLIQRLE